MGAGEKTQNKNLRVFSQLLHIGRQEMSKCAQDGHHMAIVIAKMYPKGWALQVAPKKGHDGAKMATPSFSLTRLPLCYLE